MFHVPCDHDHCMTHFDRGISDSLFRDSLECFCCLVVQFIQSTWSLSLVVLCYAEQVAKQTKVVEALTDIVIKCNLQPGNRTTELFRVQSSKKNQTKRGKRLARDRQSMTSDQVRLICIMLSLFHTLRTAHICFVHLYM